VLGIVKKAALGIYLGIDTDPELDSGLQTLRARKVARILRNRRRHKHCKKEQYSRAPTCRSYRVSRVTN